MFGKFTAKVEIPGPFKIEGKPYTMTIAGKTDVSAGGNRIDKRTPVPAETKTVSAETEPAKQTMVSAKDESTSETESVTVATAAKVGQTEVPAGEKGGNWTVVSVVIGISAAAAGIVILKITKIL